MERLRQRDFLLVNRCVQEIYTPSTLETLPAYILSILSKAVPSEVPACSKINFQSCRVSITCPPLDLLHVKHIERIAHHHFHEHPVVSNFLRSGDGQAYKISDFISESQFHQLPGLYEQYLQPLGMEDQMGIILPSLAPQSGKGLYRSQEGLITIALARSQRNFSERDRLILNLLRPHLAQAYQNAQALAQVQHDLAQLRHTLELSGLIVLTSDGQVRLMTQQAELWLSQYFHQSPASKEPGLPENLRSWVKH